MRPERDRKREEEVLRKKDNRVRDLEVERGYWGLNRRAGWGCSQETAGEAGGWTSFANKAKFETTQ